mmetsp:Transcript_18221/g.45426  ORF Transcript_18221/g.45426 Transcript_18221/m.45426 type:complete len:94 (-) Transcript_18221:159-440(-)
MELYAQAMQVPSAGRVKISDPSESPPTARRPSQRRCDRFHALEISCLLFTEITDIPRDCASTRSQQSPQQTRCISDTAMLESARTEESRPMLW